MNIIEPVVNQEVVDILNEFDNKIPDRIYKFYTINENFLNSIREGYFWLSPPAQFNDPFDCNHNLMCFNPTKRGTSDLFERTRFYRIETRRERKKQIKKYQKKPELVKNAYLATAEETVNRWGVCCFTKNFKNNLMWSHYADKHKGVCLAFNPRQSVKAFLLLNVRYTNTITQIDYFKTKLRAIFHVLATKSEDWKYEEEMRIFREGSGKLYYPKNTLKEVIFGCKTSEENKKLIISLLNEHGYRDVKFTRAIKREDSFILDYK